MLTAVMPMSTAILSLLTLFVTDPPLSTMLTAVMPMSTATLSLLTLFVTDPPLSTMLTAVMPMSNAILSLSALFNADLSHCPALQQGTENAEIKFPSVQKPEHCQRGGRLTRFLFRRSQSGPLLILSPTLRTLARAAPLGLSVVAGGLDNSLLAVSVGVEALDLV